MQRMGGDRASRSGRWIAVCAVMLAACNGIEMADPRAVEEQHAVVGPSGGTVSLDGTGAGL